MWTLLGCVACRDHFLDPHSLARGVILAKFTEPMVGLSSAIPPDIVLVDYTKAQNQTRVVLSPTYWYVPLHFREPKHRHSAYIGICMMLLCSYMQNIALTANLTWFTGIEPVTAIALHWFWPAIIPTMPLSIGQQNSTWIYLDNVWLMACVYRVLKLFWAFSRACLLYDVMHAQMWRHKWRNNSPNIS